MTTLMVSDKEREDQQHIRPSKRPRISPPPSGQIATVSKSTATSDGLQYLHTINRAALDFDPPPICCISLVSHNVYACLTCGRFFHGRAPSSPAHTHSLHHSHHLFINLTTARVHCLPHHCLVDHPSLRDISTSLYPHFQKSHLSSLDNHFLKLQLSDQDLRIRGAVGLDWTHGSSNASIVVVLQLFLRPHVIRNALLLHNSSYSHPLHPVKQIALRDALSLVCRKIWASHAFRPHIVPHPFMQVYTRETSKQTTLHSNSDPIDILSWILNTSSARVKSQAETAIPPDVQNFCKLVKQSFQGTMILSSASQTSSTRDGTDNKNDPKFHQSKTKFWFLTLDLPPKPLFKHQSERDIVPQVSLEQLLFKFNGKTEVCAVETGAIKSYEIQRTPPWLFLVIRRFTKSKFGVEKNPCVVHLPSGLLDVGKIWNSVKGRYRLIGTVSHEGSLQKGQFRVAIFHDASKTWYDVTDVSVEQTVFQLVSLRDSYVLLYELVNKED